MGGVTRRGIGWGTKGIGDEIEITKDGMGRD